MRTPLPSRGESLTLKAWLAAFFAAIFTFMTVLVLGAGLAWSVTGLLGLPEWMAWVGAGLALLGSVVASIWLWRNALRAERELAEEKSAEADSSRDQPLPVESVA